MILNKIDKDIIKMLINNHIINKNKDINLILNHLSNNHKQYNKLKNIKYNKINNHLKVQLLIEIYNLNQK